VSFLQKAKVKASEVAREAAREAADASTRAAGAVSAKAHDPETQEKLKSGLATAGRTAADASTRAADASAKAASAAVAKVQDPATQARVKGGVASAGRGVASAGRGARTLVERIDPGILAEVVIKATALQERANARLRAKGSIYRIGEIQVTASLPPGISFSIERIGDSGHEGADHDVTAGDSLRSSTELLAEEHAAAADAIVSLDTHEQAGMVEGIAAAEASMDAAVEVLEDPSAAAPSSPAAPSATSLAATPAPAETPTR
jgi:hypothetical protein